ncbi:unnamed protein product [Brassica oleracea var. botrytis]
MAQRPDCSPSYDSFVGSCNTLLSITIYKYLLVNPRKSSVSTERSPIVMYYNNQGTIEHKLCVIWRLEKDLTSSTFHLISNHTREGVLQEPSLSLKSYMGKLSISLGHVNWYTDTRLLSFCQLLRWELLVGGDCIFHIIGIAHDKSSWLLDDFLQSFMKAHGPLKISAIRNWSVFLQCQMTFCAAIVPNTKCTSVKLSKANTIQLFFFVCVLYIKRTRFSGEIELRYLIGKTLMEPLSYASSE